MTKTRDLADLGGGFIQAGTGAVQRTVESKLQDVVSVEDYGAIGDDPTHDDWAAIQAAINTNRPVRLLGKTYYISKPLEGEYINLEGVGHGYSLTPGTAKTIIKKTTNTVGSSSTRDGISYAVDSIISVVHPSGSYSNGINIKGVSFEGVSTVNRNAYGIYAPRISRFALNTIIVTFAQTGFYSTSAWDARLDHVQMSSCDTGWQVVTSTGGSTSWTANNISTNTCAVGFNFNKLNYSTFNSCYAEGTTTTAWVFAAAKNITLNGCGGEQPTGKVLSLNSSDIVLNGWQSGHIVGVNGVDAITVIDSNLTLCNSLFQDFSTVNSAKNMTVTGSGSPSNVKLINSRIPSNGATSTVDGFSTFVDDTVASKANARGFATDFAYVRERTINGSVFFNNGVFSSLGTPSCTYRQINNTVSFTISVSCNSTSAGTGSIILDVPFSIPDNTTSIHGSAFAGGAPALVYRYSPTRIRADITAIASQTTVLFCGQINLAS